MRYNLLSTETQGSMLVLLAGLFWGTSGTVQAFAPSQASPLTIGAIRITFGGIFLLLYILATRGFQGFRGKWPLPSLFYAALGMAGFQAFFFAAIRITGVAVGTMVAVGGSPAFAGLLGMIFFKERPSPYWYFSTLLAIIGCILLSWKGGGVKANSLGVLLALVASFAFALYTFCSWVNFGASSKSIYSFLERTSYSMPPWNFIIRRAAFFVLRIWHISHIVRSFTFIKRTKVTRK